MKSVLVIGQSGQVSTYLQQVLDGNYSLVVAGREAIDLSKLEKIQPALRALKPSIIINPAAYTAVDLAEDEAQQAFTINRDAVHEIAQYCHNSKTPLIHFSTDYVFSGDAGQAYTEQDIAMPTGVYGQSKYEGEQAVLKSGASALILRTSWVYSKHGKNFYKTMLALAENRDELSVVADQVGSPTYAGAIANATKLLVEKILRDGLSESEIGIYHFTCQGQTSWCDFAKAIFTANDVDSITVHPISTAEYPTPAKRPAFSVLDNSKLKRVFDVSLPSWEEALADCAASLTPQSLSD